MAIDIGRVGYEAYAESTGNKTYDGRDMPKWEELTQRIQDAWRHAGVASMKQVDLNVVRALAHQEAISTCHALMLCADEIKNENDAVDVILKSEEMLKTLKRV